MKLNAKLRMSTAVCFTLTTCFTAATSGAIAQTEQGFGLEEIVVTAQRRAESLQDVPVAITAFNENALEARQIGGLTDLVSTVPNLHISSNIGQGSATTAFIRGVGETESIVSIDTPVGFYLDDVYMGRQGVNNMFLFDVERVEVLRGPQGTLYGRNTSGGAIKVITNRPKFETEGKLEASYGRFDEWDVKGMINAPIDDKIAVRGSFIVGDGGGDMRNSLNGERLNETKVGGANLKVLAEMSETFTLELAGDWLRTNQNGRYAVDVANILRPPSGNNYVATSGHDTRNVGKAWGLSANATWDVTDTMTIKSITSYRKTEQQYSLDLTDQPVPLYVLYTVNDSKQFSQELQISGTAIDDKLNYVAGLYYFNETSDAFIGDFLFQADFINKDIGVDVDSYAAFAQLDYNVTEDLTLVVGGRWTRDEKSIDLVQRLGTTPGFEADGFVLFDTDALDGQIIPWRPDRPVETDLSFNQFTPKLGLKYAVNPDLNLFATFTKGFKSGGWSARVLAPGEFFDFDPEKINSYEIGTKGSLFGNRGNFSLTGFYYDYKNLFNTGTTSDGSFGVATSDAEIYGIELETNWQLTEAIAAYVNLSWQDGKRKAVSAASIELGDDFQRTPDWQAIVGFNGSHPVSDNLNIIYNASYSYMDKHYVNPQNTAPALTGPIDLVNALVGVEAADGQYRFTLGCRNCFSEKYIDQILDFAALGFTTIYPGERSNWTATLTTRF